ncbi:MAG TPA: MFS transporter, partial [Candidatus Binataceae bacterium]|nr:MFS transporter [Candidatus Binataceae bacterium]
MTGTQRTGSDHLVTVGAAGALPPPLAHPVGRILRRYYTVWGVYSLANGFLFAVYPLFLRARGLNQFQMNSVLASYFAVTFLTDVPTGAFADALGRRRSFVLGCLLRLTAFMVYFFAHAYPMFLVAESIDGIGTTFCNGAIDAWGVDALDDAGFAGLKDRLFSRISQLMNVGFMTSALIGTYVADVNIAWPWLMSAVGYGISAIVGARLMRERPGRAVPLELAKIPAQIIDRVANGFRQGFRSRAILMLSLANGIFFAASAPYWLEWPQYVNDSYGLGLWVVGWVYCLLTLGRLVGAEVVMRMRMDESVRSTRLIILIVAASLLFY